MSLRALLGRIGVGSLLVTGALVPLSSGTPKAGDTEPSSCADGVVIDGLLLCGADAPASLAEVCDRPQWTELKLVAGDRVDGDLCGSPDPRRGERGWRRLPPAELAALGTPIDLNSAGDADLQSLAGVGPALAARIVAARPFATPGALLDVRGIGGKTLARVRGRLRVEPPWVGDSAEPAPVP